MIPRFLPAMATPFGHGDPGGSRTPNPQIRSLMLYPVELRGRVKFSVEKQFTPNLSSHFVITESERIHMRVSPSARRFCAEWGWN
jgi:hypothetical protein